MGFLYASEVEVIALGLCSSLVFDYRGRSGFGSLLKTSRLKE